MLNMLEQFSSHNLTFIRNLVCNNIHLWIVHIDSRLTLEYNEGIKLCIILSINFSAYVIIMFIMFMHSATWLQYQIKMISAKYCVFASELLKTITWMIITVTIWKRKLLIRIASLIHSIFAKQIRTYILCSNLHIL